MIMQHSNFVLLGQYTCPCAPREGNGPGSVVGIATAYGLDGPEIESRWGEIFRTCPDRPWGPPSLLYNGYRVFPGGKVRPGRDAEPSPPSSAEFKNRVAILLLSLRAFVAYDRVKPTYHAKAYGGASIQIHPFLTSVLGECE
jgi:hypothetical protein